MNLQQQREEIQKQKKEFETQNAIYKWKKKHPELDCEANIGVLVSFIDGEEINESNLDDATAILSANGKLAQLAPTQQQENADQLAKRKRLEQFQLAQEQASDRVKLEHTILQLFTNEAAKEHERRSFQWKSAEELQARFKQLSTETNFRSMEPEELRNYLRTQREQAVVVKSIEQITLTKKELMALSSQAMRSLIWDKAGREKPGIRDQINAILRGE